jgi:vanillate O-demethylase monooxygenase subunit
MWSEDLPPGQIVARRIDDQPLVFFRGADGRPTALLDRCAHRWAPLSRGTVVGTGQLRCPYHGLEYDAYGVCVKNPHPNYRIPPAMRVPRYPLAEKHQLIWIWLGEGIPDETLIPDFSLLDPGAPEPLTRHDYLHMPSSWDLLTDNLLDTSHVAFLHTSSFGVAEMVDAPAEVEQLGPRHLLIKRDFSDLPVPRFWELLTFGVYERMDFVSRVYWHAPSCLVIQGGVRGVGAQMSDTTGTRGIHFLTPETATTCHYHFSAARWNPMLRSDAENAEALRAIADIRKVAFVDEDGAIIAAQQERIVEAGKSNLQPVKIGADIGIERAHRILREIASAEGGRDRVLRANT